MVRRSRKNLAPAKVKNIQNMGALAALGALAPPKAMGGKLPEVRIHSKTSHQNNKKLSTSGLLSQLQSSNTSEPLSQSVKTKGRGFGSKNGYDIKGLGGQAGHRGIAGKVIGKAKLYKFGKMEGLTRRQVLNVVQKNSGKIQNCYEKSLLSNSSLAGRVEYIWTIQPSGKVKSVRVKSSELKGADRLNECVLSVFRKMKFPVAKNGQTTQPQVGFPFGSI